MLRRGMTGAKGRGPGQHAAPWDRAAPRQSGASHQSRRDGYRAGRVWNVWQESPRGRERGLMDEAMSGEVPEVTAAVWRVYGWFGRPGLHIFSAGWTNEPVDNSVGGVAVVGDR